MSPTEQIVFLNAVAPYAVVYTVTSDGDPFNLATVTAVSFRVRKPEFESATPPEAEDWSAVIVSQSETSLVMKHELLSGDVDLVGRYWAQPRLTTPSGELRALTRTFVVEPEF